MTGLLAPVAAGLMAPVVAAVRAPVVADAMGVVVTAGVVGLLVVAVAACTPAGRRNVLARIQGHGVVVGFVVALSATAGSLWFSEGANFPPCRLCWYQRASMYPLVALLAVAALAGRRAHGGTGWRAGGGAAWRRVAIAWAVPGIAVNLWHVAIETDPSLDSGSCALDNPCTIRWVEGLGFWTIPRMAGVCFAVIMVGVVLDHLPPLGRSAQESP